MLACSSRSQFSAPALKWLLIDTAVPAVLLLIGSPLAAVVVRVQRCCSLRRDGRKTRAARASEILIAD